MKKLLLASAVATLSVAAHAAPTVYGQAFVTADYQEGSDRVTLSDNGSRIGFRGAESVSANTDLVYQLEYAVDTADNAIRFTSRDTFLGMANKEYGQVRFGRLTSIDDRVNHANVLVANGADGILANYDAERHDNVIDYTSPSYNNLTFMGMYKLAESSAEKEAFGVATNYAPQGQVYRGGASYVQQGTTEKHIRVSGAYDVSQNITVGALYQNSQYAKDGDRENTFAVSGTLKTETPWTLYGQFDSVNNQNGTKDANVQRLSAGGAYAFSPKTTAHVYGNVVNSGGNSFGVGGGIQHAF